MKLKVTLMMPIAKANKEENMGDIAQFSSDEFVFVAELKNCQIEDIKEDKEYTANVIFYGHQLEGIYDTAEKYHEANPMMSEESYIPMGAFNANPDNKNWKPSPMNLISSKVTEVAREDEPNIPKEILLFAASVGGQTIEQCFYYENPEDKPALKAGQYVSGIYWAEFFLQEEEPPKEVK